MGSNTVIKKGVIEEGITPPEDDQPNKPLEDHLTKRAADTVTSKLKKAKKAGTPLCSLIPPIGKK